jgi:hypothetical protein
VEEGAATGRRRGVPEERLRQKYHTWELLTLNNESLELMAGLQEDLTYIPPRRDVVEARVAAIYQKASLGRRLERITGREQPGWPPQSTQRLEVGRHISVLQVDGAPAGGFARRTRGRTQRRLGEGSDPRRDQVTRCGLPVPDGFVATTEAYRQFFGIPRWREIRDALRGVEPEDWRVFALSRRNSPNGAGATLPRAGGRNYRARPQTLQPGLGLAVR